MKIKLFNLNNDIAEKSDVSGEFPEVVKQIEEIMIKEHDNPVVERFNIFPSGQ